MVAFDTGSMFTWVEENRINSSTTYQPVECSEFMCHNEVSNGGCSKFSQRCLYSLQYGGGFISDGEVGKDIFSFYSPNKRGHDSNPGEPFEMIYGTLEGNQKLNKGLHGVIGAEGLRKALQVNSFSICYPRTSNSNTYVRFGVDAFIFGKTTPIARSFGHFLFKVNTISNGGLLLGSNMIADEDSGMYLIFYTGAGYFYLHPIAYDSLIDGVKKSVDDAPMTKSIPSGYDLCYKVIARTSYKPRT